MCFQPVQVRINGLVCIGKLLPMLDKWFVYDEVFKILFQIKSREPGIMMAILGIFQTTFNHKKLGQYACLYMAYMVWAVDWFEINKKVLTMVVMTRIAIFR